MNNVNFISAASYVFSGVGAFFLCRSYLNVTAKEIALQAKTFIGGNDHLLKSLSQQNADALVGFNLTLVGVLIGFLSLKMTIIFDSTSLWSILAVVLFVVFVAAVLAARTLHRKRLRLAKLFTYSFFVDEYLPDYDQARFNLERAVEAIKDFNLQDEDVSNPDDYERVIHLLSLCGASHTIQKIRDFRSRNSK